MTQQQRRSGSCAYTHTHLEMMLSNSNWARSIVVLATVAALASPALSFAPPRSGGVASWQPARSIIGGAGPSRYDITRLLAETEDGEGGSTSTSDAPQLSLEEKMKSWEASEEEIKAASLGGITAGSKSGTDGFDVGLWVMFPFIVATSLLFFVFPFIKDSIDVSSVGPPPMV